jgi:hypothetical protein
LQLTTVAEDHPQNKQLIRCRLLTRWSLQAKVAFWSLCGFELLVLGIVGGWLPWLWLLLLTLPLMAWFLRGEQRTLQSMIAVFLDELAEEWRMTKLQPVADSKLARPVETPGPPVFTASEKRSGHPVVTGSPARSSPQGKGDGE